MRAIWRSLALALSLSHIATANPEPSLELVERQNTNPNASTWVYTGDRDDDDGNFIFTISVNPDNDDLWFRMSAPYVYSWIGIGVGSRMKDASVFFIAYEGSEEDRLTISARRACDDCEPGAIRDFGLVPATTPSGDPAMNGVRNGTYFASGFIANGTRRAGIDPNSRDQSFMFAVGPVGHAPFSDAVDAPLRMHAVHGTFRLDMTQARGTELPPLGTSDDGVADRGGAKRDRDYLSRAHATLMGFGFVILIPLGIIMLRVLNRVNLHAIVQGFALLVIAIGWVIGFIVSKRYQRSMSFNSPHQIIGIILYILLLAQWALGFAHHRVYKRTQQPTWMIKPHKYGLGGVVLALGIINMTLGFRFAVSGYYNMVFVPIVIGVLFVMIGSIFLKKMLHRRAKASVPWGGPVGTAVPPPQQPPFGAAPPYGASQGGTFTGASFDQRNDYEMGKMGPPPAYNGEPTRPREMI